MVKKYVVAAVRGRAYIIFEENVRFTIFRVRTPIPPIPVYDQTERKSSLTHSCSEKEGEDTAETTIASCGMEDS
jgi:hypothetical protein